VYSVNSSKIIIYKKKKILFFFIINNTTTHSTDKQRLDRIPDVRATEHWRYYCLPKALINIILEGTQLMEMSSFSSNGEPDVQDLPEENSGNNYVDVDVLPDDFEPSFARKALIFATYTCVIFAISSPLTSYPAMQKEVPGFDQSSSFFVMGVATAGTGFGKILPGYLVARFGARRTYLIY
jgi:hypothetical protein